jgi:uncharacterized protein YcbK (DUF882 family)
VIEEWPGGLGDERWNSVQYKYFTPEEVQGLDEQFVARLEIAREKAGIPFIITSGLRTPTQNESLPNAVSDSSHLTGHAVDLAVAESQARYTTIKSLLDAGFNRLGIYSAHVHVDDDGTKPPNCIWYVAGA